MTDDEILERARNILRQRKLRRGSTTFRSPDDSTKLLSIELANERDEVFCAAFLTTRHTLIAFERLFVGTINGATVHARTLVTRALHHNAAAVILAHNHPSGVAEPSQSDRAITKRVVDALALIDVHVIDHLVVGDDVISFANRGWI